MKWWQKVILGFTILVGVLYLGSWLAMFISPEFFWPISFLGLGYFPVVILYSICMIIWLFMRRKIFWWMFLFLAMGFTAHFRHFGFGGLTKADPEGKRVYTILQYNVQGFDAYNKEGKYKYRDEIVSNIGQEKPDVVCLEEFNTYTNHPKEKSNLNIVLEATGLTHYYYYKAYENEKTTRSFGLIILSRFPIVNSGRLEFLSLSKLNSTIYADIAFPEDTIRVFCNHLQSTQLSHRDLEFIEASNEASTDFDAERITNKLKMSFALRAQEADTVNRHMALSPHPIISCGDFNDTPVSYTYQKMSRNMQDAFLVRGIGIGATYSQMPVIRIDYMLFEDDAFKIIDYMSIKENWSDHYPCVSRFTITTE